MNTNTYFYQFLEPISKELALLAKELDNSIFSSPRTMLTHSRVFIENILQQVTKAEGMPEDPRTGLKERLDLLNDQGYLIPEIRDALHLVRRMGNQAAHDARMFRFSEALLSWEALYSIVKWYVEVYGPVDVTVPEYQDPSPQAEKTFDMSELEVRLKGLEDLLKNPPQQAETPAKAEVAAAVASPAVEVQETPGFTPIRTITYKGRSLEIPYFLRDAFLLPQRFDKSETFLIRLGAEQEARIMSELPGDLDGLHKNVKRYNEKNDEQFFEELGTFIEEEKVRRNLTLKRQGELFFFYKASHIVVTEELKKVPLTAEDFTGIPSLLRQLNEDQIYTVGQLPMELVILAKYANVGVGTVEKLFDQLKAKVTDKSVHADDDTSTERKSFKKWESLYVKVKMNGCQSIIEGSSVPAIWKEALKWIEDNRLPLYDLVKAGIILGSTDNGKRYGIALQPIHPDQRPFTQLHTYQSQLTGEVYYLETKINPKSGLETLGKVLTRLGVEVDIPLLKGK
ncbi:DUF4145 domain-containing protein [Mesobacillus selenatarsenatis]|uniref:DUF4145 domain-containing protein n=1 Tax=Mesobacillus selenatarsenatis (strain DSM 18680 / JCM 14380 / FERM P-15431 / SF-1) TaxID=1321606 RepID=A0A0A8WX63_MESS1|nr:DUF4145 domain-containing protein [Mesobacillus selenatarsenatis]GAM12213.1 hypothetical protein SAMD00020551_0344 [Mesobacillus selenatarsenatis SF-1]